MYIFFYMRTCSLSSHPLPQTHSAFCLFCCCCCSLNHLLLYEHPQKKFLEKVSCLSDVIITRAWKRKESAPFFLFYDDDKQNPHPLSLTRWFRKSSHWDHLNREMSTSLITIIIREQEKREQNETFCSSHIMLVCLLYPHVSNLLPFYQNSFLPVWVTFCRPTELKDISPE